MKLNQIIFALVVTALVTSPLVGGILPLEKAEAASKAGIAVSSAKVNINTAGAEELVSLKGVGAATAQNILNYREANGRFKSVEDLQNVKGIGGKRFERLKDQIAV